MDTERNDSDKNDDSSEYILNSSEENSVCEDVFYECELIDDESDDDVVGDISVEKENCEPTVTLGTAHSLMENLTKKMNFKQHGFEIPKKVKLPKKLKQRRLSTWNEVKTSKAKKSQKNIKVKRVNVLSNIQKRKSSKTLKSSSNKRLCTPLNLPQSPQSNPLPSSPKSSSTRQFPFVQPTKLPDTMENTASLACNRESDLAKIWNVKGSNSKSDLMFNFFEVEEGLRDNRTLKLECKLCQIIISCVKGNNSNIKRHLERVSET